jgi:hypothetical protein
MAFEYKIEKNIATINDGMSNMNVEVNLISWNGRKPTYDIRKWSEDHEKMSKGISLNEEEIIKLFQNADEILKEITGEDVSESLDTDDVPLPFD